MCVYCLLYLFVHFHQEKQKDDDKKKKLGLALCEEAVTKGIPRTMENHREAEPIMITNLQDEDFVAKEANDHYMQYYYKVWYYISLSREKCIMSLQLLSVLIISPSV